MSRRTIFLAAVVTTLLVGPAIALLWGGGKGGSGAKRPVTATRVGRGAYADVRRPVAERPLPRSRPQLVEPVAGETAEEAAAQGAGVQIEGPKPTGRGAADDGPSPGAPSDDEVREDLVAQEKAQKRVRAALRAGRYSISFGSGRLSWPLPGFTTMSSPFGPRWGRLHAGVDIPGPIGTKIHAADSGTVVLAGPTGGYGNYTCVQHTKALSTCYAHQSRILVRPGEDVRKGQVIGLVGSTGSSTGPHLHFETRIGGRPTDPVRFF